MLDQTFTIVDVETTGGSPFFNRVIELGVLRVERGEVVREFKQLLDPGMELPEYITNITGLTDADLAGQPTFEDVADEVLNLFDGATLVAHNAQFDYSFLKEEFRRLGYAFYMDRLCTVRLSRALYPEHTHHNLTALIERFKFECEHRHRAFDDAKVLWDFLQHANVSFPETQLAAAVKRATSKTRMPRVVVPTPDAEWEAA